MKIYIAGPISGMPGGNKPAFEAAVMRIKSAGHEAVNPHDLYQGQVWADAMRCCLAALMTCDAIYPLVGWSDSRGAMLEMRCASAIGLDVWTGETNDPAVTA